MVGICHSQVQNLKLAGLCCCAVSWLNWKDFVSSPTKCFVLMPLNYFMLLWVYAFQLFSFSQDNNLLSKHLKLFANKPLIRPDLYYAIVYLNKDCIFQNVMLHIQDIPSLIKKIKENHDPFKYFGSPELCQYFGSLLLNMYTVNITLLTSAAN